MSSCIRQNAKIKGLSLDENGSKNIKLIQYADDATIFEDCSGNERGNKLFRRVQKSCWNKIKHNKKWTTIYGLDQVKIDKIHAICAI